MRIDKHTTLDEFASSTTATSNNDGSWDVDVKWDGVAQLTLTHSNCTSEFNAKEKAYSYLMKRIKRTESKTLT